MWRKQPALMFLICISVLIVASVQFGAWERREAPKQAQSQPRVVKPKEVIGQVVGGPMILNASGKFVYAVYVWELDDVVCLDATKCPVLDKDERVVIYKRPERSEWYTFLSYAQ